MAGRGTDILLGGNPEFLTKEYLKKQKKIRICIQTSPADRRSAPNGTRFCALPGRNRH
jgi:preprotein translocase subunit SecA